MATFNVAHLITLIGVGSIASSVVADEQQNQNKTQNGGGGLKHLLGSDVFTELRDKQNAMAEKMSGIETKLEKQIENGGGNFALMTMLTSNRLEKEIEDGMRENRNAMAEKMSGIEAKLEKQIENGMRETQTLLSTKLENQIENVFTELRNNHQGLTTKIENGMRDSQNLLSNKLENQIENVYTKLRDNQNASVTEMENRIENGIRENQNALAEKVSETEAKLENQIENVYTKLRDNQNALAEKVSETEAKLENGMRENQNALAEKVSETEAKLENGIQNSQKALSLMKNMATLAFFHFPLPIYHRWNASDCHPKIVINESTNAIQNNGTGFLDFYSCRAGPIHMPSAVGRIGIIYAEYRILAINGPLRIGLSTKEMPLVDTILGFRRVSYGYANDGRIESTNANGNFSNILENVPRFGTGDDVGCGLNWATRQLFFTKNGQRLNITNLYVDEGTADLYPTVTMLSHGDAVEANFGPNFQYDLSKKF